MAEKKGGQFPNTNAPNVVGSGKKTTPRSIPAPHKSFPTNVTKNGGQPS